MPRTLAAGELFKKLTGLTLYRIKSGGGSTTTAAAVTGAGSETTVDVVSATGFAAADTAFIIGENGMEQVVIGGTPATTMPVTPPPKIAAAIGARFVESEAVSLGKIPLGSVSWAANKALTAVFEEIGDAPLVYIPGSLELELTFALYGYNGPNIQLLTGYAEAETGDGAAYATAYQSVIGLPGQAVQGEQLFRVRGLRHDGKNIEIDFLNAYIQAAINSTLGREAPAQLQGSAKASALIVRQWT